jgi:hypothetical protein
MSVLHSEHTEKRLSPRLLSTSLHRFHKNKMTLMFMKLYHASSCPRPDGQQLRENAGELSPAEKMFHLQQELQECDAWFVDPLITRSKDAQKPAN